MSVPIPDKIKSRQSGSGCSCSFYKITSRTGVKLFTSKMSAERSYEIHKALVGDSYLSWFVPKLRSKLFQRGRKWGYAIEIVKTYVDDADDRNVINNMIFKESYHGGGISSKLKAFMLDHDLVNKKRLWSKNRYRWDYVEFYKQFILNVFNDEHNENFGVKGRKVVWIDFSLEENLITRMDR